MAEAIDTTGPRPYPDQAMLDDVHVGVILHKYSHIHDEAEMTVTSYVVTSELHRTYQSFRVITLEQAERFDTDLIMTGKFGDIGDEVNAHQWGITDNQGRWSLYYCCVVGGTILDYPDYTAIELTEEINDPKHRPQVQTLVQEVGRCAYEIVNLDQPYDDLMRLMSTLDRREATAIILWYGLNKSVVQPLPTHGQIGEYFGIDSAEASRLIHQARTKMAAYVVYNR